MRTFFVALHDLSDSTPPPQNFQELYENKNAKIIYATFILSNTSITQRLQNSKGNTSFFVRCVSCREISLQLLVQKYLKLS